MSSDSWEDAKSRLPVGMLVVGKVAHHTPFGIFVDLGAGDVLGLVLVTDFKEGAAKTTPEDYPALGAEIEAAVLGHRESERQIALSLRPSALEAARRDEETPP